MDRLVFIFMKVISQRFSTYYSLIINEGSVLQLDISKLHYLYDLHDCPAQYEDEDVSKFELDILMLKHHGNFAVIHNRFTVIRNLSSPWKETL